jgi:uncharacterized protein
MGEKPRRAALRRVTRVILVTIVAGYALLVGAAYLFQRQLIYLPTALAGEPQWERGAGAEVVSFRAPGGPKVYALYAPPRDAAAPVAVVLHGNAGNLKTWSPVLERWVRAGCGALLLDPRGYGWSEGSPSEEGWLEDGEAALDWLEAKGIVAGRLVLHGVSIGCGVAVPLAAGRPVKGLILESPFTSLADAAHAVYPYLPCRLLLRDRYDNVDSAPRVACPVLVMHGTADEIVPVEQGRRLAAAFPKPATLCLVEGGSHNGLTFWPGYDPAIASFMRSLP